MSFAITSKFQTSASAQTNVAGGVKPSQEQPAAGAGGESVEIGINDPRLPGPHNPCLIGGERSKTQVQAEVKAYFKADEAYDKQMYQGLGIDTVTDKDGFLDSNDEQASEKLLGGLENGDFSGLTAVTAALNQQIEHMKGVTPPPELKAYHEKAIASNEDVAAAMKELKPMLEIIGELAQNGGDFSKIDPAKVEPIIEKLIAAGGDPSAMLGNHMQNFEAETKALKAERLAVCKQFDITPGQWD